MPGVRLSRLAARRLITTAASTALFVASGAASGAPGLYPQETLATPYPSPLPNTGTQAIAFVNSLGVSVAQRVPGTTNDSAGVPLCLSADERRVGHAYAIKEAGGANASQWVSYCYIDGAPIKGARILKPRLSQSSSVKWAAMRKGQALPRQIAPVAYVEAHRVPVYVCKDGVHPNETVGTLLPDGSCRLAKTLTSEARTVESSQVLLHSATADASPAYGWIDTKEGSVQPGGELLKWPNGAVYCTAGGYHGVLKLHNATSTSADKVGSMRGCEVIRDRGPAVGGTGPELQRTGTIRVFRNDGQSGVAFQSDVLVGGRSTRPEVSTGAPVRPCYATGRPGHIIPENGLCKVVPRDQQPLLLLRRIGNVPGEGDRA